MSGAGTDGEGVAGAAIAVQDLVLQRGGRTVLDIPAFALPEGQVTAVIGANGAGKSSLVQALALLLPARMRYFFAGRCARLPADALALRRQMAVVFQDPLLLAGSVQSNVALGLHLRRRPAPEIAARVDSCLGRLGIAHLAHRPARSLSGGEAQRVNLARSLAVQPRVLFLDEPCANLDAPARSAFLWDLRPLLQAAGITALIVSHDFAEVALVADRVAVLAAGRVVQTGTPEELFRQPLDERVSALVRGSVTALQPLLRWARDS